MFIWSLQLGVSMGLWVCGCVVQRTHIQLVGCESAVRIRINESFHFWHSPSIQRPMTDRTCIQRDSVARWRERTLVISIWQKEIFVHMGAQRADFTRFNRINMCAMDMVAAVRLCVACKMQNAKFDLLKCCMDANRKCKNIYVSVNRARILRSTSTRWPTAHPHCIECFQFSPRPMAALRDIVFADGGRTADQTTAMSKQNYCDHCVLGAIHRNYR